jgi:isocitrate/isopropylmalate dehydrogenase
MCTLALIAGDGTGGEVTTEAMRALFRIAQRFGHAPLRP